MGWFNHQVDSWEILGGDLPDTHCRPEAAEAAEGPNVGGIWSGFFQLGYVENVWMPRSKWMPC